MGAACLETGLLGASEVVRPRGVRYFPHASYFTQLQLQPEKKKVKNSVCGVGNNDCASTLWGRRSRVEAFIRSSRKK